MAVHLLSNLISNLSHCSSLCTGSSQVWSQITGFYPFLEVSSKLPQVRGNCAYSSLNLKAFHQNLYFSWSIELPSQKMCCAHKEMAFSQLIIHGGINPREPAGFIPKYHSQLQLYLYFLDTETGYQCKWGKEGVIVTEIPARKVFREVTGLRIQPWC